MDFAHCSCHLVRECTAEDCFDIDLEGNIRILTWNAKSSHLYDLLSRPLHPISLPVPEPRVAMILNRYALSLPILYVSSTMVLGLNPDTTVGTAFLSYILPSQRQRVEAQIRHIKSAASVLRMRFGWMVPTTQRSRRQPHQASLLHSATSVARPCEGVSSSQTSETSARPVMSPLSPAPEALPKESTPLSSEPTFHFVSSMGAPSGEPTAHQAGAACFVTVSDREVLLANHMDVIECEAQLWGSMDGIVCVIRETSGMVVSTKNAARTQHPATAASG